MARSELVAKAPLTLFHDAGTSKLSIEIGHPKRHPTGGWSCRAELREGGALVDRAEGFGADSVQALMDALIGAAAFVNDLRDRGTISYYGRSDGYFCLDELLRTPATEGYLPTRLDGPEPSVGQSS